MSWNNHNLSCRNTIYEIIIISFILSASPVFKGHYVSHSISQHFNKPHQVPSRQQSPHSQRLQNAFKERRQPIKLAAVFQCNNYYKKSVLQLERREEQYQGRLLRGLDASSFDGWGSSEVDSSGRKMHVSSLMSMYFMPASMSASGNKNTLTQISRH